MNNLKLVAGDTDGLALTKPDQSKFTKEEREAIMSNLNAVLPELVQFEDEGVLRKQLVVATKNYVMQKYKEDLAPGDKEIVIKGSSLKATYKEPALRRFVREVIDLVLKDRKDRIYELYVSYARQILTLTSIEDWASKKTLTKAVLTSPRTNETRVLDALSGSDYREGDKFYVFFKTEEELCLRERFDGTYCVDTLLSKLYETIKIFHTIIDVDLIPNFSLKRNKGLLVTSKAPETKVMVTPKIDLVSLGAFQTR